jgi:ArsR family transcriptional regulator, arsenate/arsenite/antimonite-responsive transcriptional repressor
VPDIFDVISDPTRRSLLDALRDSAADDATGDGELGVNALVDRLGISQPTVSKHLKVLREAGLVTVRDAGQRRLYRLEPDPLASLAAWLRTFDPADAPATAVPDAVTGADAGALHGMEAPALAGLDSGGSPSLRDEAAPFTAWAGGGIGTRIGRAAADVTSTLRRRGRVQ